MQLAQELGRRLQVRAAGAERLHEGGAAVGAPAGEPGLDDDRVGRREGGGDLPLPGVAREEEVMPMDDEASYFP